MKTSGQNHLRVPIITFLMCIIQVNGATLNITASTQYPNVSTSAYLTCHIPSFTGGAEWYNNGLRLAGCLPGLCIPPSSARYQYSADATTMTVTIPSLDIALDDTTWTCSHDGGTDRGDYNLIVYKLPSTLYMNGFNSSILYDGDKVHLSVSTGCIHPSGSAHYTVIWKYVEATSAAENNFGTIITQTFTSVGGCPNTYEDNLMFNLYLTNRMNTGNTTLYISQVKMTFTMAGINFYATMNVAYNVTSIGTAAPTPSTTTSTTGKPCQLERGLGPGLGSGIPIVFTIIVVVIFVYKDNKYGYKLGRLLGLGLFIAFQVGWIIVVILISTGNQCKHELGFGLGLAPGIQWVIACIVAVILIRQVIPSLADIGKGILISRILYSACEKPEEKTPEPTDEEPEEKPTKPNDKQPEEMPLGSTGQKNKSKDTGPPAIHTGNQNKVKSETTIMKINGRSQPLPPVAVVTGDTPKPRAQPPRPENIDVKDPNQRGISANFDDKQGLPTETPPSNKLPPLEDASKEPKKKRRNKKKKGQINKGNPEEEMVELTSKRTLPETPEDHSDRD